MRVDCKIRTVGDFRRFTKGLDDDFKLDVEIVTYVPEYEHYEAELEFEDIGYGEKLLCIGVCGKWEK